MSLRRNSLPFAGVRPIQYPDGQLLYDMQDLDRWIDGLKGGSADDDDAILSLLE